MEAGIRRSTGIVVVGALLVAFGSAAGASATVAPVTRAPAAEPRAPSATASARKPSVRSRYERKTATVLEVVDGDTLRVRMVSTRERVTVRLLGIDAPVVRTSSSPDKCGGPEAAESLRQLTGTSKVVTPYFMPVPPKRVRLDTDERQKVKDSSGRVQAYASTTDERVDLALAQLKAGWVETYQHGLRVQRANSYFNAELAAEAAGRGFWSNCAPAGTATAPYVKCDDPDWQGEGPFDVRARRVDCSQAVTVALRYPKGNLDVKAPPTIKGFRCRTRPISVGVSRAICSQRTGLQVVRFDYQA